MIQVKARENKIELSGHARDETGGSSEVCAAVSALTQALIRGLQEITEDPITAQVETGHIVIEWQIMSDKGRALIDAWYLGILGIGQYIEIV